MNKIYILILIIIVSCSSDDDSSPDYTLFLEQTSPRFSGEINGAPFNWKSSATYNSSNGIINGAYLPLDLLENETILTYSLNRQSQNSLFAPDFCNNNLIYNVINGIDIGTPKFEINLDDIENTIFDLGNKNIGEIENAFRITVYLEGVKHCIIDEINGLEILKTETVTELNSEYIYSWMVFKSLDLTSYDDGSIVKIDNVKLISKFLKP